MGGLGGTPLPPRSAGGRGCSPLQVDGVRCASSPSLGRSLQADIHFDLQLLGLWVVMIIINGIARGGSPCVLAPPSLATEERMMCERSTYEGSLDIMDSIDHPK